MLSLMSSVPVVYRIVVHAARAASWFFRHGSGKVARGIEGRRKAQTVLGHWVDRERDPDRPIVWIHAPSVGEALQAEAVALALAARVEGIQVVFTHFSPSAEAFVKAAALGCQYLFALGYRGFGRPGIRCRGAQLAGFYEN